jgi:hypothetical protein
VIASFKNFLALTGNRSEATYILPRDQNTKRVEAGSTGPVGCCFRVAFEQWS